MMKRHAKPTQFLLRLLLVTAMIFVSSASTFSHLWAATSPFGTFAYDGTSEAIVGYDGGRESSVCYDDGSVLASREKKSGTTGNRVLFTKFGEFLAAETVGSGPASGFLEVSDAYASSRAVQNFASPTATDFIFDSQSGRFIMGDGGVLGHDAALAAGRIAPSETTVGGTIWRQNGSLMTDEWSGHYGQNWTPEIRQQFQNFMQQHGVNVNHTPWGQ